MVYDPTDIARGGGGLVSWGGVGTYICKVICCSFRGDDIGVDVHMR